MALKLCKRRNSTNWYIRGTLRGIRIEESTGTSRREHAEAIRIRRETAILDRSVHGLQATLGFTEAAVLYMEAGGERRFLGPLIDHFQHQSCASIDQIALDQAALNLYPRATAATRNRQVYTPVIAILKYAGVERAWKRPKVKEPVAEFVEHDYVETLLPHCPPHLAALLITLHYSGRRSGELLRLDWEDVDLSSQRALIRRTKNGDPFIVHLSAPVLRALRNLGQREGPVFRYKTLSGMVSSLRRACERAGLPYKRPHVIGRHSFASHLMRSGVSQRVIMEAGGWKSHQSMMRYTHVMPAEVRAAIDGLGENLGKPAAK